MSITLKQELVLKNLAEGMEVAAASNDKIKSNAASVFAASVALMSLSSAGEMIGGGSEFQAAIIGVSSLFMIAVTFTGLLMYDPKEKTVPGSIVNSSDVRDFYIDVDDEAFVLQVVSDRSSCFVDLKEQNTAISKKMKVMLLLFMAQSLCVGVAVFSRAFG